MTTKQLSLFSLLCITTISNATLDIPAAPSPTNATDEKETIAQQIKSELFSIHNKIKESEFDLKQAKEQKEKEWQALTECLDRNNQHWFSQQSECQALKTPFSSNSPFTPYDKEFYKPTIEASQKSKNTLADYNAFYLNFKRYKEYNDHESLEALLQEIINWNKNN